MKSLASLIALVSLALAACVAEQEPGELQSAVTDGTPDAIGLLAFLNDPGTTFEVLDDDVPLDRRAAENLIAHRDGPDAIAGSADDDVFETVAEVDDVAWVGEVSIERMIAFAESLGYVPSGDDVLGSYDGVTFTVAEAERVLRAVNEYSEGVLRYEVPLDVRAVNSIIDARPIHSMPELAELYYVGTAMLTRLKDYTAVPEPGERPDCRSSSDCPDGWYCTGKPFDGSGEYGKCYDPTIPEGADESCSPADPCNDGLVCLGEIAWGSGFCVPEWQRDSFTNIVQRYIPPTGDQVVTSVTVYGLATVPVDIAVTPDIRHDELHALRVTLRSPNGDESVMWDGPSEDGAFPAVLTRNCCIPSDDYVNGRWFLIVENVTGEGLGNIHGWTLEITSQWD